jgi:hypothetical protein
LRAERGGVELIEKEAPHNSTGQSRVSETLRQARTSFFMLYEISGYHALNRLPKLNVERRVLTFVPSRHRTLG